MTYQKPTLNYGSTDADELSQLYSAVANGAEAATKKRNTRNLALVATCFLFFTLGVIYQGNSNRRGVDFTEASLLRSGTAFPFYDPSEDYCFRDNLNTSHYCWYPSDSFPYGDWNGVDAPSNGECGEMCDKFLASDGDIYPCDDDHLGLCNHHCAKYCPEAPPCGNVVQMVEGWGSYCKGKRFDPLHDENGDPLHDENGL